VVWEQRKNTAQLAPTQQFAIATTLGHRRQRTAPIRRFRDAQSTLSLWILVREKSKGGWISYANELRMKKRGVPRLHENMLPGNSFPQICVVSGTIMWISGHIHKST
jgi:hypothetical protein